MEPSHPRWLPKGWSTGTVVLPIAKWDREHYIPIRPYQLVELLEPLATSPAVWDRFQSRIEPISNAIRNDYHAHRHHVTTLYSKFDPDREVDDRGVDGGESKSLPRAPIDEAEIRQLFGLVSEGLVHANYRRLSPREILLASRLVTKWGVRLVIRFSSFRRLEVYGRGDIMTRRTVRDWKRGFRKCSVEVPIYQRLAVVFRTKELQEFPEPYDPNALHIRLFKNVPKADIDMMFPGVRVRLSWLDTGKIGIPTLWGIVVLASKIAKNIWIIALLGALKMVSGALFVVAFLIAAIVYGLKSFFSYGSAKRRYQLSIARSFYFQNLDTNLGALLRLEEEGEGQEICEAIVAYFVIANSEQPLTEQQIDQRAEEILMSIAGFAIDFDANDALRDLANFGFISLGEIGWSLKDF